MKGDQRGGRGVWEREGGREGWSGEGSDSWTERWKEGRLATTRVRGGDSGEGGWSDATLTQDSVRTILI